MIKRFNISKPEKYTKDGVEKTVWHNVGTLTQFTKDDGSVSRIIEIPAIGLKANVFEQKPKDEPVEKETVASEPAEPSDIPF